MRTPAPRTFEVGLVMAGAVSAGAYTAGVIDFLLEALTGWEAAKTARQAGGPDVPDHAVKIRVAAGSSAGGLCSALLSMLPFTGHFPVNDLIAGGYLADPANGNRNLLYDAWVRSIDITGLLGASDLGAGGGVPSLLDGNAVKRVADAAIASVRGAIAGVRGAPLDVFANPLHVYLTVTNLRGVPYLVKMTTAGGVRGQRMVTHADYGRFAVFGTSGDPAEPLPRDAYAVNPGDGGAGVDGWDRLGQAALATAAFPGGLPARAFSNDRLVYESRPWPQSQGAAGAPPPTVDPDLADEISRPYEFWTVDGGVLNNEPLEYARIALSGAPDAANPRDPKLADRAVLMIDPFPEDADRGVPPRGEQPGLLQNVFGLIPTWKDQARFQPDQILKALNENIYSRFLIAPLRDGKPDGQPDMASFGLAGFAGFLHRHLRMHDFQLGRRNAQKFLKDHFCIHVDNPIVKGWVARLRQTPGGLEAYQPTTADGSPDADFVQIVPLVPALRRDEGLLPWPQLDAKRDVEPLKPQIRERVGKLTPVLVGDALGSIGVADTFISLILKSIVSGQVTEKLEDVAYDSIESYLRTAGLLQTGG